MDGLVSVLLAGLLAGLASGVGPPARFAGEFLFGDVPGETERAKVC